MLKHVSWLILLYEALMPPLYTGLPSNPDLESVPNCLHLSYTDIEVIYSNSRMPRKRRGQRMSKPATSCGRPFWCHVTFKRSLTPTLGSRLVFWSTGASHQSDRIGRTPWYGGVTPSGEAEAKLCRHQDQACWVRAYG